MRVRWLAGVCLLLGMTWPGLARAQDALTGESIQVHATFFHVGVMVTVSGDDNRDASAALEVSVGGSAFVPAHRLSRVGADRFVGSAFYLPDGTAYEVRVTLSDPDGVSGTATLTASGTTRILAVPQSTGDTIHVSPDGNDITGDGSTGSPYQTVGQGLAAAQPGDTVLVHAGVYHEEIDVTSGGSAGAPITLAAAGDGLAVLDGADPDLKDPGAWTDEGGHVYSAPVALTRYVSVDGLRLWRYESLGDLQSLSEGTDGGFFFDGSTVYVRLPGDAAPTGHEIQVSTFGRALWLEGASHLVIRGLVIRCFGAEEYSQGVMVRDGSHQVWIVENTFENVMPGIWVKNDVDDLTVMDNEFSDYGLAGFSWSAVKAQGGMESGALALDNQYDGQGIVFYRNVVHDSFDGLGICGDQAMAQPNNADVLDNVIFHLGDDGIETDGMCSNIRILGNRFEDTLVGVSVAPSVGGPTYVFRNLMVDLKNVAPGSDWMTRAMKFNVGDSRPSGEIFAYHNTAVTHEADQPAWGVTDDSRWEAVHLLNNIWVGTDYGFYHVNSGDEPLTQDYDLIFSTGTRLIYHQGDRYASIAEYFGATGLCEHCLSADPVFTNGLGGDYTLDASSSPAVDEGVVIPGVNEAFNGAAPDLGALETGEEPTWPDAGPRPDGGSTGRDAGVSPDGGTTPDDGDDEGCGCSAGAGADPGWLFWLLVLGWWRRRR